MDNNEKLTNNPAEEAVTDNRTVSEEQLEEAAGGKIFFSSFCFFVPANPLSYELRTDGYYVKCKSACYAAATCACNGHSRCVNKMHLVGKTAPGVYYPMPVGENGFYNHYGEDKKVTGLPEMEGVKVI